MNYIKTFFFFLSFLLFTLAAHSQGQQDFRETIGNEAFGSWDVPANWKNNNNPNPGGGDRFNITIESTDTIIVERDLNEFVNRLTLNVKASAYLKVEGNFEVRNHLTLNIDEGATFIVTGDIIMHVQGSINLNGTLQANSISGQNPNTNNITGDGTIHITGPGISGIDMGDFDGETVYEPMYDPLPVELLSFEGSVCDHGVELKWVTATETNNMGFEIQRQNNQSQQWEVIGWVDGHYNHNGILNYSFTDNNPEPGVNYYRLKQMDYDGKYEYLGPLSVVFDKSLANEEVAFRVIKSGHIWHIAVPHDEVYLVEVYETSGRKLYSREVINNLSIPAPGIPVIIRVIGHSQNVSSRVVI